MSDISYKNLFTETGATVTFTAESTGFEAANAYDNKQYDWWKPGLIGSPALTVEFAAPVAADYVAIWGHNLGTLSASYRVDYSDDGSAWTEAFTIVSATDDNVIYKQFTSASHAYWRVVFTVSDAFLVAGIQLGERTTIERDLTGLSLHALAPKVDSKTAMSELGVNLGASIKRTGVKGNISMSNLSPAWVRSDLSPLIAHLNNGKMAVFSWDPVNYPEESLLIWKGNDINPPKYSGALLLDAVIPFEGAL